MADPDGEGTEHRAAALPVGHAPARAYWRSTWADGNDRAVPPAPNVDGQRSDTT